MIFKKYILYVFNTLKQWQTVMKFSVLKWRIKNYTVESNFFLKRPAYDEARGTTEPHIS